MTPIMQRETHTLQLLLNKDDSCKEELTLNERIGALVFKVRIVFFTDENVNDLFTGLDERVAWS